MSLTGYFISLVLQILLLCHETVLQNPEFIKQPQNPSSAREGAQLILRWSYNLRGQGISTAVISNVTNGIGAAPTVAGKKSGANSATVFPPYQHLFSVNVSDTQVTLTFLALQVSDSGNKYRLQIQTDSVLFTLTSDVVDIGLLIPAKISKIHGSPEKTVQEGSTAQLVCEATGEPTPNITWARVFENGSVQDVLTVKGMNATYTIANINKTEAGTYHCTANNDVGMSDSQTLIVKVLHPPIVVSLRSEYKVELQQSVSLDCQAEGYPEPSFSWTPCNSMGNVCNQSKLYIQEVLDDGVYTCTVKNNLGEDSAQTNIFIAGKNINVTFVITSESCNHGEYNQSSMLSKRLNETISKIFVNESAYQDTVVRTVTCGSIIVDLTLTFSAVVKEAMVLSILKEAAKDGNLGEFSVEASSIKGTRPMKPTTSSPLDKTTPTEPKGKNTLPIVLGVVGGIVGLAIIGVCVICCIRMKKKESKEVDDEGPGRDRRPGAPDRNDSGYANAGKPPPKPARQGNDQGVEIPMYAQVDKSKKKPKPPPNTYTGVGSPNGRERGELQYSTIDHSDQGGSMARGPGNQLRRPLAHTETHYAELV